MPSLIFQLWVWSIAATPWANGLAEALTVHAPDPPQSEVGRDTIAVGAQSGLQLGGGSLGDADFFVDIVAAAKLADGSLLVADAGEGVVRHFHQDGRLVSVYGGRGEGPGEFRSISSMAVVALTSGTGAFKVFDRALQRVTEFRVDEGHKRTVSMDFPAMLQRMLWSSTGVVFGRTENHLSPGSGRQFARSSVDYFTGDEGNGRSIVRIPGPVTAEVILGGEVGARFALFSPFPSEAVWNQCLFVTSGDDAVIRVFTAQGGQVSSIPFEPAPRSITTNHIDGWIEHMALQFGDENRGAFSSIASQTQFGDVLPYTNAIIVDRKGLLWRQVYTPPTGEGRDWEVWISLEGTWQRVELPEPMRVLEIGVDYLLGVWVDDLGEQHLRQYSVTRHGEARDRHSGGWGTGVSTHPECI